MPLFFNFHQQRPNKIEDAKDAEYHLRFGRWALSSFNHQEHQRFLHKAMINWSFFKGHQWIMDEDLEGFFLDESGGIRNRLKFTENLIRPMVSQFEGNAVRLNYNAKAVSVSDEAINRREQELERVKFFKRIGDQFPNFKGLIQQRVPVVSDTMEETEIKFNNSFVDDTAKAINSMSKYIAEEIDLEQIKVILAKQMAITGLGVYKGFEQNQRYVGDWLDSMFFLFDRGAKQPDLSDSEFMGEWYYMDTSSIFERWQNITSDNRKAIERYAQTQSINLHRLVNRYYQQTGSRVPVYEIYWKDIDQQEYGYVDDGFGYPYFTRINSVTSDFTDDDLLPVEQIPEGAHNKILKGDKNKRKLVLDTLRYCIFIPREEIGDDTGKDIILDFGEVPYQETYKLDPSNVKFPYKCHTWAYDKGEILSPLDDVISPQRFLNRVLSVAEGQISNLRGTGTVLAKQAVDPDEGEAETLAAINASKPITVDIDQTGSVANSVGTYGTNLGSGTLGLFNIIRELQTQMQNTTGINEAMTGTQGGANQLVGVIQQQIQRGTLIQEPFYFSLTRILKQAHESITNLGKRIYADNPRRMAIMVGDAGAEPLIITKDMKNTDFRIFIQRTEGQATLVENGNNLIMLLLQSGLLDRDRAANLFNRADANEIADAMREHAMDMREAERRQAQKQAEDSQQVASELETQTRIAEAKEEEAKIAERTRQLEGDQLEIDKIDRRTQGQIQRDLARK